MEQQSVMQQAEKRTEGYLTFALDNEAFGVRISDVTEIIGVQPITPLPNVPYSPPGEPVINLAYLALFALQHIDITKAFFLQSADGSAQLFGLTRDNMVCEIAVSALCVSLPTEFFRHIQHNSNRVAVFADYPFARRLCGQ